VLGQYMTAPGMDITIKKPDKPEEKK